MQKANLEAAISLSSVEITHTPLFLFITDIYFEHLTNLQMLLLGYMTFLNALGGMKQYRCI